MVWSLNVMNEETTYVRPDICVSEFIMFKSSGSAKLPLWVEGNVVADHGEFFFWLEQQV